MAMGEGGMKRKRKKRGEGGSNKAEPQAMEMMCPLRLEAREKAFHCLLRRGAEANKLHFYF